VAETVKATYNGFPVEVVYSASVQELVFYFNPDAVRIEDRFDIGHRTFTGITLEQWRALQNVLQRPNIGWSPTVLSSSTAAMSALPARRLNPGR
jgi:hypothetical protein